MHNARAKNRLSNNNKQSVRVQNSVCGQNKRALILSAIETHPNLSDVNIVRKVKAQYGIKVSQSWVRAIRRVDTSNSNQKPRTSEGVMYSDVVKIVQLTKDYINQVEGMKQPKS